MFVNVLERFFEMGIVYGSKYDVSNCRIWWAVLVNRHSDFMNTIAMYWDHIQLEITPHNHSIQMPNLWNMQIWLMTVVLFINGLSIFLFDVAWHLHI